MADQPDRSLRSMMTIITLPKVPKRRMRVVLILPNQPPSRPCGMNGRASMIASLSSRLLAALLTDGVLVLSMLADE